MKPKGLNPSRGRSPKGKVVKKELPTEDISASAVYSTQPSARASVEIIKCISFQKFRYSGENRPGKKYQEKEFMTLKLSNLQDKVVRVVIICTDADNRELIHPNGLVGKDCHDGIYDKEYAITKQFFIIKIPYLRTERMKTKKNEHKNILGVLSARASHLPSPYKERCLSQCTDKYTSSREKFDTTKVCLGVIVTVESHQGILNGSLHAISHVVRNASEKTSLSILKLSHDSVPALSGAHIDIFTTEDGPAIEPDKYLVYVSYDPDVPGADKWESDRYSPGREALLYKRVITYQVPPFEPNPHLVSPVTATIHLECPQSNQYCECSFQYVPSGEMVIVDGEDYIRGQKRSSVDCDIKLSPKRLRTEMYDNDGSTQSIKANLKTKIKSRNETSSSIDTVCIDSQGDSQEGENATRYAREHKNRQVYSQDCPVLIHHQDPQTGESSYLLDMDASKSGSSNGATFVNVENEYVIQFHEKGSSSILQGVKSVKSNPQDLKVVATGYSDTVPPNAVLVYTTNGFGTDRIDDGTMEHVLIQTTQDNQVVYTNSPSFRHAEKHPSIFRNDGISLSSIQRGTLAKITRGDTAVESRLSNYGKFLGSDGSVNEGLQGSDLSIQQSDSRLSAGRISYSANSSGTSVADRCSPVPTLPSVIPPLRRMLINSKAMSSASPWEVDNADDSASDYNIVIKTFEASGKRMSSEPVIPKNEPLDEDPYRQRNELYSSPSVRATVSSYQQVPHVRIADKQLHMLRGATTSRDSENSDPRLMISEERTSSTKDDSGISTSAGLSSADFAEAIANNLPTMQIIEIAEQMENNNEIEVSQNN